MNFTVQQWQKTPAEHHTQHPLSHATLDRRKRKSAPCFANMNPVHIFFAKSRYHDDNHGTSADFVNVLPFCRGERVSKTQQPIGRVGEDKMLVSIVFSLRLRISSYIPQLTFFCLLFFVRSIWLIVVFPSSCATAALGQRKNERLSSK